MLGQTASMILCSLPQDSGLAERNKCSLVVVVDQVAVGHVTGHVDAAAGVVAQILERNPGCICCPAPVAPLPLGACSSTQSAAESSKGHKILCRANTVVTVTRP